MTADMHPQADTEAKLASRRKTKDELVLSDVIAQSDIFFYPGEHLKPDEIRVTLMGTGWGSVIRPPQKSASIFIELGNGESFVFDAGSGCGINYNVMQVPFNRMTKIFLTHLHMDHCGELPWIYAFGPSRNAPLEIWGPSGLKKHGLEHEVGTKACVENGLKQFTRWHTLSFECALDVGNGYELQVNEFNYLENPGIAYQKNGVTIKHWPALHIIDGAVSYRLEWNGLSVCWSGDTQPNHFTVENAKGADLLIHETAPSIARFVRAQAIPEKVAERIISLSHTPAKALGKIFQLTKPKLGVTCHCPVDAQELDHFIDGVRCHWAGHYQMGEDLMVFNVSKKGILIRNSIVHERPWGATVSKGPASGPTKQAKRYQTSIFDENLPKNTWKECTRR